MARIKTQRECSVAGGRSMTQSGFRVDQRPDEKGLFILKLIGSFEGFVGEELGGHMYVLDKSWSKE